MKGQQRPPNKPRKITIHMTVMTLSQIQSSFKFYLEYLSQLELHHMDNMPLDVIMIYIYGDATQELR
jgi:hypothetical protein